MILELWLLFDQKSEITPYGARHARPLVVERVLRGFEPL
jgi:hypothetical protein